MNDTIQTIFSRRSIRGFLPDGVVPEDMKLILECAMSAPSARNQQDWQFTVIQDKAVIDMLNKDAKSLLPEASHQRMLARFNGNEDYSLFYNAPVLIAVSVGKNRWAESDGGMAAQNICLAAESLGYGTCVVGMGITVFESDMREKYFALLGIPEDKTTLYFIALGRKAVNMPDVARDTGKVNYI